MKQQLHTLVPNLGDVLPRLVLAYEQGRLVPFIGAGMSVPACHDWEKLVIGLETQAQVPPLPPPNPTIPKQKEDSAELVRRANRAVQRIRAKNPGGFAEAVRAAVFASASAIPKQSVALARLWWPLVLSTNYDDLYALAFARHQCETNPKGPRSLKILGRSLPDCQFVLHSLTSPGRAILWALQGYLGGPKPAKLRAQKVRCPAWGTAPTVDGNQRGSLTRLAEEIVVGHGEYRRITHRDLHFRRAFAEVFRSRSLLFLGSGVKETYVQALFDEVLEMYGPCSRPHYALLSRDEQVDAEFLLARYQIIVSRYDPVDDHRAVIEFLDTLADAVETSVQTPVSWSWGWAAEAKVVSQDMKPSFPLTIPSLEVVRGPLIPPHSASECLAVSAGGIGSTYYFSDLTRSLLTDLTHFDVSQVNHPSSIPESAPYLFRWSTHDNVLAVRAREGNDQRSLDSIYRAATALFQYAFTPKRFTVLRVPLLAAGGWEKRKDGSGDNLRPFPARYSFIQIVRAFGDWLRGQRTEGSAGSTRTSPSRLRLIIHVIDPTVHLDIASGRLDVGELLACRDIRFWTEVVAGDGLFERRLFQEAPDQPLSKIRDALGLEAADWDHKILPSPRSPGDKVAPAKTPTPETLSALGVVPGSLVRFTRRSSRTRSKGQRVAGHRRGRAPTVTSGAG